MATDDLVARLARFAIDCDRDDHCAAFIDARARIEALEAQLAALDDANAVHVNLLRGSIARPTVHQMIHIYSPAKVKSALDQYARNVRTSHIGGEDDN